MKNPVVKRVEGSQGYGIRVDRTIPYANDMKHDSSSTFIVDHSSRASPLYSLQKFALIQFAGMTSQETVYNSGVNKLLCGWEYLVDEQYSEKEVLEMLKEVFDAEPSKVKEVGVFGETILHFALLMHKNEVAKWLMDEYPDLKYKTYGEEDRENSSDKVDEVNCCFTYLRDKACCFGKAKGTNSKIRRYHGEGCLHITIANQDFEMAKYLLTCCQMKETFELIDFVSDNWRDRGYPLNLQRATGDFFLKTSDDCIYYGATALDFAVSTDQKDMVDLLMGYTKPTVNGKGKFNGKQRANMKLRDFVHQNTVFHLCALKGHIEMWGVLMAHMADTVQAEMQQTRTEDLSPTFLELKVERWVRSQINACGLTPLQVAGYRNDRKMVECILKHNRLKIWKQGTAGFYGYPLNEIDEYFKSPKRTPGIPLNYIILCEGNFELLGIELIGKLMLKKWSDFGKLWVSLFLYSQIFFCFVLTGLFLETYPHLSNPERSWGSVSSLSYTVLYLIVLLRVLGEMLCVVVEMVTL